MLPLPSRRGRWGLRLLLVLALFLPRFAGAQQLPSGFEQGLFEIRIGSLPASTLTVFAGPEGRVLLPLRPVVELSGTPMEVALSGASITLRPAPDRPATTLDLAAGRVLAGDTLVLGPAELVRFQDETYLSVPAMALLLAAKGEIDWESLTVLFTRSSPFPGEARRNVEAQRATELRRGAASATTLRERAVPYRAVSGAGVLDWALSGSAGTRNTAPALRLGSGSSVLGGMLTASGTIASDSGAAALLEPTVLYHRVFPNGSYLRQLQIGDHLSGGLRARSLRGVSIGNAPYTRRMLFDEVLLNPELPPGWQYEVYESGRLVGFSEAATERAVSVPLQYGSTPVQVKMYGPSGETRVSTLVYSVPVEQLRRGATEYAAGAGTCARSECTLTGYLDVRRGLTRTLTAAAGFEVEQAADSAGTGFFPYVALSALLRPGTVAELQALAGSFVRATLEHVGARNVVHASAGVVQPGSGQFSFSPLSTPRWQLGAGFSRPSAVLGPFRSFAASGRVEGTAEAGLDRTRISTTTSLRRLRVEAGFESGGSGVPSVLYVQPSLPVPHFAPRWLWGSSLGGSIAFASGGLHQAAASTSVQIGSASYASVSVQRLPNAGTALFVGFSRRLGFANVQTQAASTRGALDAQWSASGSVAFGGGGGLLPLPHRGTGMAGIGGRVFYDVDGDGRFSAGDRPLPGAAVRIGSVQAKSAADGGYRTWSVLPFDVVQVAVDTVSLAEPGWVPTAREVLTRPAPNVFTTVDIALVQTRELTGRVAAGRGVPTAGGVTVELRNRASGETQRTVTYSDGEYYVSRVRPGTYELTVAASSLRALNVAATPAPLVVTVAAGAGDVVEAPAITLAKLR